MEVSNNTLEVKASLVELLSIQLASSFLEFGTTVYSENDAYPYLGVVLLNREEKVNTTKTRLSTIKFGIAILVRSTISLSDAYLQRDLLVDDGNGGGVEPLLRQTIAGWIGTTQIATAEIKNVSYIDSVGLEPKSSSAGPWTCAAGVEYMVQVIIQA
jgi:hypothetical protein